MPVEEVGNFGVMRFKPSTTKRGHEMDMTTYQEEPSSILVSTVDSTIRPQAAPSPGHKRCLHWQLLQLAVCGKLHSACSWYHRYLRAPQLSGNCQTVTTYHNLLPVSDW